MLSRPGTEPTDLDPSCSLDVAERWGGATLTELAEMLGVSPSRVDHMVAEALKRFRAKARDMRMPAFSEKPMIARTVSGPLRGFGLARGHSPKRRG